MLISLGNIDIIAERCKRSQIGQQRRNSLWVHTSALEQLDPLLKLVMSDYPGYEKFANLSEQELSWGLLDDFNVICTNRGWERCLESHCAELKGHRVVWKKDVDDHQKKLAQTARR